MTGPIRSLAPWFGGKRAMAPEIVRQVCGSGKPSWFGEPFCGSMAVSLAMPEIPTHVVNDLHSDLINFANVLASPRAPELLDVLERTLTCEDVYEKACAQLQSRDAAVFVAAPGSVHDDQIAWAWAWAVSVWLGPNGLAGTNSAPRFCKRYSGGGGDPATRWRSFVESADGIAARLRRLTILHEDGFEMLAKVPDTEGTALYVDPPYFAGTRSSGEYRYDFTDDGGGGLFGGEDDHARLAKALIRFTKARVVVSYYDDPRLAALYPGWARIELDVNKNTGNASGGASVGREVLLVNGDPA